MNYTPLDGQGSNSSENIPAASKLTAEHQAQIEARGIYLDWAAENCMSCDIQKASVILDYPAKSPGIMLMSDDYGQWQFRPDEPWASKDGKMPKYRTGKGEYDAFLAKHPTIESYWTDLDALKARCFTIDGKPYLLVTEGGFKGIAGCQHGIPTVALVGVTMGLTPKAKGEPDLIPVLKRLAKAGFGFIIAFDADAATNRNIRAAESKLVTALLSHGCAVRTVSGHWGEEDGKGMDDFIQNQGIEEFTAILEESKPYSVEPRVVGGSSSPGLCKNALLVKKVEEAWGERLRLNEMTQQIEMDGKASNLDVEKSYLRMAQELDLDIDKQKASDLVALCAQKNTYSPVREYLNSVAGVEPVNLETLAERYFGTDNPLHATLLKRTLIAAVARVFKPGCKVDTLCILQGDQGFLKSTFWQTLTGEPWFTDNLSEANEKDEKLKLRRYWILEFSEFETAYKRKEVEQLKAFLSSRIDSLRRPYGRVIEDFPRTSVFVGSTNRQEFLHDPTGERRYWVIPVKQKIPIQMLEQERDRIWAAAVAAYNSGEQWWLTPEEDELLAQANKNWQSSDSWEADVLNYLQDKLICTVSELLTKVIQIELAKQNRAEQMRLSDILRRNGWVKASKQKRIEGKAQWYWEKVMTGCDKVMTEVMTSSNPCSTTLLAEMSQPVITFTPNNHPELPTHPRHHILIKNQRMGGDVSEQSLNQGCDTSSDNSQNLVEQELEGVITSPNQGCDTPLKLEKITDEDAQKLRDLALLWWPEYYPGQMQTLQSQMYGWSAPGTRYDVTVIAEWLESQDELIRDRLTELINLRES